MTRHWFIGVLWFMTVTVGCQQGVDPRSGEVSVGSVEEHHGIPAHKPRSFADAVLQLVQRVNELDSSTAFRQESESFRQLLDIVRWLPELAADTDLARADWEHVQRLSRDLERELMTPKPDIARCRQQLQDLGAYAEQVIVAHEKEAR